MYFLLLNSNPDKKIEEKVNEKTELKNIIP
jgi:hypothetical protein